jgi:hypothetical protein
MIGDGESLGAVLSMSVPTSMETWAENQRNDHEIGPLHNLIDLDVTQS